MTYGVMVSARKWCRYYVLFRKAVFFIWGLILVHSWVEYALVALLITHLTDILHLPKAASVVNLLDGTTAVLMLINAYLSETYVGPFVAVVCTTVAYISGLLLFYFGAGSLRSIETQLLYAVVILIGSGRAGRDIQLKEFLADQMRAEGPGEEEERVESRRKIWWRSAYVVGIIASAILFTEASWMLLCKISMISMGVALVGFSLGFASYERKKPAKSTLNDILLLLFTDTARQHPLHRARTSRSTKELKSLLKMLPIWSTFLVYGLLLATANTFFYQQTDFTANYLGHISAIPDDYSCNDLNLRISNKVPVIIFVIIRFATTFLVSRLCDWLLSLHWGENIPRRVLAVRSGFGLAVSPICCVVAWRIEEYRVQQRNNHAICLRFSWLMPQFLLMGLMEGLVFDGMQSFYVSVVPQSLKRYGPTFTLFALNIGHFTSLLFVFIFRGLFEDNLNFSRLGVYYRNIGIVCSVNLVIYCCVASVYVRQEAEEEEDIMEQPLEQIQSLPEQDPDRSADAVVDPQLR